jgi:replicative DNA helicase Mcm
MAMDRPDNTEIIDRFLEFYRTYCADDIGQLAQAYPNDRKSLYLDWEDLYRFDRDMAEDYIAKPGQMQDYAEEALRLYDLPADVKLGNAHVRMTNLGESTGIREIRERHHGNLISVQGTVNKATSVRPKLQEAAFECQRCGTLSYIPQHGGFTEPHQCEGCERQGPFNINFEQSEFVDAQTLRVQESPEGLRGGQTPEAIDINIEDDITGEVTAGDHVRVTGILRLEQQGNQQEKSLVFEKYMDGVAVEIEDEEFDEMDITEADKQEIIELSNDPEIYDKMVQSMAPSIWGYETHKLAIIFQLFSGVTKHLPDDSRIRGDMHMLLIGDPGTGKSQLLQYVKNIAPRSVYTSGKGSSAAGLCVTGDTRVHTADGFRPIGELAREEHPEPVDADTSAEREFNVYTYDRETGEVGLAESSHVWRMPEKDCRRIETAHGKELEASVNTPVLVCGTDGIEWRPISEVDTGDHVAVPRYWSVQRSNPSPNEYLEFTNEKLRLTDDSIEFLRERLCEEYGSLRDAAAELDLPEDFIYDSLPNRFVPQDRLDRILEGINSTRADISVRRAMLCHGDDIRLPKEFDADLLYLVGLVFGDGDISVSPNGGNRGTVRISNSNESLLRCAASIMEEKFGKRPQIEYQEDRVPCIRLNSATIARFFRNLGMRSPKVDLELDARLTNHEHADAFLRGLFDADGSVSARSDGGSSIQYSTISGGLAEQVQLMLETYGVRVRSRDRDRRGETTLPDGQTITSKHVQTHLTIYGRDIEVFADAVGFRLEEKEAAVESLIGEVPRDDVRVPVGDTLAQVAPDGGVGEYYMNFNRGNDPGRTRAREITEEFDLGPVHDDIVEAATGDVYWDEITSVENTGQKEVYDLTVPETHNFLGNGLVVHNTATAVRDDFGEGDQWSLEAGALVLADKGIAAVDELDKMDAGDRSAMHEALEQQSYHPETEVLRADGQRVEIGELVDGAMAANPEQVVDGVDCEIMPTDDLRVHSVDLESNETTKLPVDRVSRHEAPDEFVRIRFSNGREVTVTPEHPMFIGMEGRTTPAAELEPGAFVPAPRKLPNSTAPVELPDEPSTDAREKALRLPDELTADFAELLGLLVAEGHSYAGSSHEIGFSNQDERLLARAQELAERTFGIEPNRTTNAAGTVTLRWISTRLYRWFEATAPEFMRTARDKRIPGCVLGASEEHIRRFLVGAFADDGGVESEAMSFSTASDGLAEDYADALAKIGVASRIHHDTAEDSWKVYVMGDSTTRFVEQVVEPADDRHDDAVAFAERSETTPRHHDVLPTAAARELRDLRRSVGLSLTGEYRTNLNEGFGVQIETVHAELAGLRERIATVRESLPDAGSLREIRKTAGWSQQQLADSLDGVSRSTIDYAERGGYDAERRDDLAARGRAAVRAALESATERVDSLESACDLRYYKVTDVETVPNAGEHETEWVYDVTVEPTNTFVSKGVVLHNSISVAKAGINATLKSRCSLLGAANPKYGRFDEYEAIPEQIDLEPALISRFDLIFTITDKPDEEEDRRLARHIIETNYAGELHTHRENVPTANVSETEVAAATEDVEPVIDADLFRKYVAHAKRSCYPTMTEEARSAIEEFYVDLRSRGEGEDAPVPVTARKLEALVRLAEASARVRLSDTVEQEDADRVIDIVRKSLEDVGMDPETNEFDADMIEAGTSKSQRDRIKGLRAIIEELEEEYEEGAPYDEVIEMAVENGEDRDKAEHEIEKLKQRGEVYEPSQGHLRTT